MNILKLFEAFNRDKIENLIDNKKTYIFKKLRDFIIKNNNEYIYLIGKLKSYNFNKFIYTQNENGIFITPDKEYMNLYEQLCNLTISLDDIKSQTFNNNLYFYITLRDGILGIDFIKGNINLIDFDSGVPEILMGSSLGYNLYKLIINKNNYISSNRYSSEDAFNLWYNLLQDPSLYGITSNTISVLIKKNISDIKLKEILEIFPNNLEYDDELIEKIIKIYGTLDIYTQRY